VHWAGSSLARWLVGTLIGNRHSDASPTMQVWARCSGVVIRTSLRIANVFADF